MAFTRLLTGMPKLKYRLWACKSCGRRQRSVQQPECPRRGCYRQWMTLERS